MTVRARVDDDAKLASFALVASEFDDAPRTDILEQYEGVMGAVGGEVFLRGRDAARVGGTEGCSSPRAPCGGAMRAQRFNRSRTSPPSPPRTSATRRGRDGRRRVRFFLRVECVSFMQEVDDGVPGRRAHLSRVYASPSPRVLRHHGPACAQLLKRWNVVGFSNPASRNVCSAAADASAGTLATSF